MEDDGHYAMMSFGKHSQYHPHCTVAALLRKHLPVHGFLFQSLAGRMYYQGRHRAE